MSSNSVISSAGRALTPGAIALMLMLCLSWGFNQIAVKLVLPEVPPMLQAFGTLDLGQNRPLRAGDAIACRLAVGIGAHHPLHLAERKQKVHIHGTAHRPRLHKLAI